MYYNNNRYHSTTGTTPATTAEDENQDMVSSIYASYHSQDQYGAPPPAVPPQQHQQAAPAEGAPAPGVYNPPVAPQPPPPQQQQHAPAPPAEGSVYHHHTHRHSHHPSQPQQQPQQNLAPHQHQHALQHPADIEMQHQATATVATTGQYHPAQESHYHIEQQQPTAAAPHGTAESKTPPPAATYYDPHAAFDLPRLDVPPIQTQQPPPGSVAQAQHHPHHHHHHHTHPQQHQQHLDPATGLPLPPPQPYTADQQLQVVAGPGTPSPRKTKPSPVQPKPQQQQVAVPDMPIQMAPTQVLIPITTDPTISPAPATPAIPPTSTTTAAALIDPVRKFICHKCSKKLKTQAGLSSHLNHCDPEKLAAEASRNPQERALKINAKRREMWETKFKELKEFKRLNRHCRVPSAHKLGGWVAAQRREYRKRQQNLKTQLTDERVLKLVELGFDWGVHASNWDLRYGDLLEFKRKFRHVDVPGNYKANPALSDWVHRQRSAYKDLQNCKQSGMTSERVQALEAIGFKWTIGRVLTEGRKKNWYSRLKELKEYKEKYNGDVNSPHLNKVNPDLASWAAHQRYCYRNNLTSLSGERRTKLEELGFIWEVSQLKKTAKEKEREYKRGLKWENQFQDLVEYKATKAQEFSEPIKDEDIINSIDLYKDNPSLASWCNHQRYAYAKKYASLTEEKKKRLESIGFLWVVDESQGRALKRMREEKRKKDGIEDEGGMLSVGEGGKMLNRWEKGLATRRRNQAAKKKKSGDDSDANDDDGSNSNDSSTEEDSEEETKHPFPQGYHPQHPYYPPIPPGSMPPPYGYPYPFPPPGTRLPYPPPPPHGRHMPPPHVPPPHVYNSQGNAHAMMPSKKGKRKRKNEENEKEEESSSSENEKETKEIKRDDAEKGESEKGDKQQLDNGVRDEEGEDKKEEAIKGDNRNTIETEKATNKDEEEEKKNVTSPSHDPSKKEIQDKESEKKTGDDSGKQNADVVESTSKEPSENDPEEQERKDKNNSSPLSSSPPTKKKKSNPKHPSDLHPSPHRPPFARYPHPPIPPNGPYPPMPPQIGRGPHPPHLPYGPYPPPPYGMQHPPLGYPGPPPPPDTKKKKRGRPRKIKPSEMQHPPYPYPPYPPYPFGAYGGIPPPPPPHGFMLQARKSKKKKKSDDSSKPVDRVKSQSMDGDHILETSSNTNEDNVEDENTTEQDTTNGKEIQDEETKHLTLTPSSSSPPKETIANTNEIDVNLREKEMVDDASIENKIVEEV